MKLVKKILVFALIVAMTAQTLVLPTFAATGDGEVIENYNDVAIMPAKGGAGSIATLTFDDGRDSSVSKLVPLLQQYNIKASLMLVPYRLEGNYGSGYSTVAQINTYLSTGVVDVQSHGLSLLPIAAEGTADYREGAFTSENVHNETYGALYGATDANVLNNAGAVVPFGKLTGLKVAFPEEDVLTFAYPGSSYRPEAVESVMQYYYAARSNAKGNSSLYQTLDPTDDAKAGGWYNPYITWLTVKGDADKLAEKLAYIDTCVNNGGWFIAGAHDIVDNPTGGNDDMTPADAAAIFERLSQYQEQGKVWVATFGEATKYIRERQNSTVSEYSTSEGLFVKVTMKDKTENGLPLDPSVFNMPLTVRVEIPDGWTTVRFRQLVGSEMVETYVGTQTSGGKTFALVDVVPNGVAGWLTDGNSPLPQNKLPDTDAVITDAKGGANGIVSMTFDDGKYDTAVVLNELFAEYGLVASLMMTGTLGNKSVAEWEELFRDGRLEPQSHSIAHVNVNDQNQVGSWTEADYRNEIGGSKTFFESKFPAYDCLTFAVPNSNYNETLLDMVGDDFYAVRSGMCPLSPVYDGTGAIQSLNPAIPGVNGTKYNTKGNWYNPYTVRLMSNQLSLAETNSPERINTYLSEIAKNGGWFISITHDVVADDDPRANPTDPGASRADMTVSQAKEIFAHMQALQNQGKIWVTTFSEATKYVREHQNATVTAYNTADGMFVDLTMADMTADGLPLSPDIFNVPLTVKIKVPSTWGKLTYTQAGTTKEVECFSESGYKFAYIDLIPNGGSASILNTGDPTGYVESLGMKQNVMAESSLTLNLYLPKDNLVTGVYLGRNELTASAFGDDMLVYSVGDINVKDIYTNYNLVLKFNSSTGYSDYTLQMSVMSYFEALADNAGVTETEKQLAYNFLVFARATKVKLSASSNPDVERIDAVLEKLKAAGCTAAVSTATPSNLGTLTNVLTAADMAINEKPYYLFYVKPGFTGKLTLSYTDGGGLHTTEFDIINGYYHCKDYVIFEVAGVYSLASELTITAVGKIGDADISSSGNYSMKNYADGVNSEYVNGLYSWVLAAAAHAD